MLRSFFIFSLLTILTVQAAAQGFVWRRALPYDSRSVAFNPLSHGNILFAGPGHEINGIFRSDDGGTTWTLHNTDTLSIPLNNVHQIFCVPGDTSVVLAVTLNRLYRSTDGGMSWYIISDTIGGIDGEDIAWHATDSTLYYGQNFGYALWKSKDDGATWFQVGFANPDSIALCSLDVSEDVPPTIIQGAEDTGLLARSTDDGVHWQVTLDADTGTNNETEVPKVVFSKYARAPSTGRNDVALAIRWLSTYRSLVATPDGGLTWRTLPSPSTYPWSMDVDQRAAMISSPSNAAYPLPLHFFIGLFGVESDTVNNGMIQETTDGGVSWRSTNFPKGSASDTANPLVNLVWVLKYDTSTGRIAAATDSGVYIADSVVSSVADSQGLDSTLTIEERAAAIVIETNDVVRSATLFDMLGRTIYTMQPPVDAKIVTIPTGGIIPGMYALQLAGVKPMVTMVIVQ